MPHVQQDWHDKRASTDAGIVVRGAKFETAAAVKA
jgi:hypothetical protein